MSKTRTELRAIVDSIISKKDEQAALSRGIGDIYAGAKDQGFSKKTIHQLVDVILERRDGAKPRAQSSLLRAYLVAYERVNAV